MITLHHSWNIEWQARRMTDFSDGLKALGIPHTVTTSTSRIDDNPAILFGTTLFRQVERTGPYLLVDRASFGDGDAIVQLVWNGHGRRGDHKVPEHYDDSRWKMFGETLGEPQTGSRVILCGQTETYSPDWDRCEDWYDSVPGATHFRPHPAGRNPTHLPEASTFDDCGVVVTLNSSIGVKATIEGYQTEVHDAGGMAHDVTDREAWAHWLAWTQWTWDEIREGKPIGHLFDG